MNLKKRKRKKESKIKESKRKMKMRWKILTRQEHEGIWIGD